MGKKKKVFIDKKNSATFKLLARDTSSFHATDGTSVRAASECAFFRIDSNHFHVPSSFMEEDGGENHVGTNPFNKNVGEDIDSIFADAPDDIDEHLSFSKLLPNHTFNTSQERTSDFLDGKSRKEILELGLPDDGYNYLQHLREIGSGGAGSAYYQNSKATLYLAPLDVKAYDASRLNVTGDESKKPSIYDVASKTFGAKLQNVIDPDVARLLEDSDLSRFGSDTEDFEEDFVLKANLPEDNEGESEEMRKLQSGIDAEERGSLWKNVEDEDKSLDDDGEDELDDCDKPRIYRILDEQFDMLAVQEYNDDTYNDEDSYLEKESGMLVAKLNDAFNGCKLDSEVEEQYRVPGDYVHKQEALREDNQLDDCIDVIRKCREYAEKYCAEKVDDEQLIMIEESSDESEVWDCETIVSTYSNLDNHPGKIQVPNNQVREPSKKLLIDTIKKSNLITLRGKEKLPMEFLPHRKKDFEKINKVAGSEKQNSKPRREESKDEKKERKVAVKEERREARRVKKGLKELYRGETYRAQKVVAVSMPSAVHLM